MRQDIEKYELIEKFLKKELSEEELKRVSQQIASDPHFAREVKQHQAILDFIIEGSLLDLKSNIKDVHKKSRNQRSDNIPGNRKLLYTVAGIIILTSVYIANTILKNKNTLKVNFNTVLVDSVMDYDTVQIQEPVQKIEVEKNFQNKGEIIENEVQFSKINKTLIDSQVNINMNNPEIEKYMKVLSEVMEPVKPVKTEKSLNTLVVKVKTEPDTSDGKTTNCINTHISANILVENSCKQFATGKILIDQNSIEGGLPPYLLSIDNKINFYALYQFGKLNPGSYTVWIQDKNNCFIKLGSYTIDPVDCDYEFIFAPDKEERWKIPNEGYPGEITIYNQNGLVVYRLILEESMENYWDGTSISGMPVPMGIYSFIINYQSGPSGFGNVTIVR